VVYTGQLDVETRIQAQKDSGAISQILQTGRPIEAVNLQMTCQPVKMSNVLEADGHFCKRSEFVKMYERPPDDMPQHEIFLRPKQQALRDAKLIVQREAKHHAKREAMKQTEQDSDEQQLHPAAVIEKDVQQENSGQTEPPLPAKKLSRKVEIFLNARKQTNPKVEQTTQLNIIEQTHAETQDGSYLEITKNVETCQTQLETKKTMQFSDQKDREHTHTGTVQYDLVKNERYYNHDEMQQVQLENNTQTYLSTAQQIPCEHKQQDKLEDTQQTLLEKTQKSCDGCNELACGINKENCYQLGIDNNSQSIFSKTMQPSAPEPALQLKDGNTKQLQQGNTQAIQMNDADQTCFGTVEQTQLELLKQTQTIDTQKNEVEKEQRLYPRTIPQTQGEVTSEIETKKQSLHDLLQLETTARALHQATTSIKHHDPPANSQLSQSNVKHFAQTKESTHFASVLEDELAHEKKMGQNENKELLLAWPRTQAQNEVNWDQCTTEEHVHAEVAEQTQSNVPEKIPSENVAQDQLDAITQDIEEAIKEHADRHGNIIGVIGWAGIGKTTSMKAWVRELLKGNLVEKVTFLFFISIRNINFSQKMNLLQFLVSSIIPDWPHSPDSDRKWLERIRVDRNVVIALDGLDEAGADLNKKIPVPKESLYATTEPAYLLLNLLSGHLLPFARVIVSSRPDQLYKLSEEHRPKFVVQILGLGTDSRDQLGFQVWPERYNEIRPILKKNPDMYAYCYVPVNFLLTVDYLISEGETEFVCMTRVLASACARYSTSSHCKHQEECELDKLAKLAWVGYQQKQIFFEDDDLKAVGLSKSTIDSFLNVSVMKSADMRLAILDGHKLRFFSHLIWQEFFAAMYLMLYTSEGMFNQQVDCFVQTGWEVVGKFFYGLCNIKVYEKLRCFHGTCSVDVWKNRRKKLKAVAINSMKSECRSLDPKKSSAKKTFLKKVRSNEDKRCISVNKNWKTLIQTCGWIHEANDNDITQAAAACLPNLILVPSCTSVISIDVANLIYVLQSVERPRSLVLNNCNFVGESLVTLTTELAALKNTVCSNRISYSIIIRNTERD